MPDSTPENEVKKRTGKIKAAHKEAMREKMSFTKTLKSIDEAEDSIAALAKAEDEPSNARIGAYKALLDSKWKKMDRLLPALKAIEHTGVDGEKLVPDSIRLIYG